MVDCLELRIIGTLSVCKLEFMGQIDQYSDSNIQ